MGRAKKQKAKRLKKKSGTETKTGSATVARNRKAGFDFHLGKEILAGMVLLGSEVKSLRNASAQLKGAYAKVIDGEVFLLNCHIPEYKHANQFNHDPDRAKKLLLNRYEIERIELEMQKSNKTLVATKVFFKKNRAKVALALAEGKKLHDKRADKKQKDAKREAQRVMKDFNN